MDAATLKEERQRALALGALGFPHLYGCGHIEGRAVWCLNGNVSCNFRIFMDAATLKECLEQIPLFLVLGFPHLYGCGHIEGSYSNR